MNDSTSSHAAGRDAAVDAGCVAFLFELYRKLTNLPPIGPD